MNVLLSSQCPGLSLGTQTLAGKYIEFSLLPSGAHLLERIHACQPEVRQKAVAIVTMLTDSVREAQLIELKKELPQLKLLANYAVGYNNVDIHAAASVGISVCNTPGVLGDATADLALTLLLMVARRVFPGALEIRDTGAFPGWSPNYNLGLDLAGKTLGIVGYGDIGQRFATRASALGMRVVALKSSRQAHDALPRLAESEFLKSIDVLSLHCPLTPETRGWLNAKRISQLKKNAIVINTSRGDVVDEIALAEALQSGHLFGAGLDVFCGEPVLSGVLRSAPNLVVLPHLGSATLETRAAMGGKVLENITALVRGDVLLPTQVVIGR
ncbi:D-glycerate dehydrogenase [bacterium]|nr:D-glycerate dehydrogenase [bacterium]